MYDQHIKDWNKDNRRARRAALTAYSAKMHAEKKAQWAAEAARREAIRVECERPVPYGC